MNTQNSAASTTQDPATAHGPVPGGAAAPTESHALATAVQEEAGTVQHASTSTAAVTDLGWNEPPTAVPAPLVGGLGNEELWTLVRRFNKQVQHVRATPGAPPGGLDLNVAELDEFSPDKLRSNVERLYMTVIVGGAGFAKHVARLRSWREAPRTAAFCGAYFTAWVLDLLWPTLLAFVIALVVYPPCRHTLFPPAPLALVDASTGALKKPAAGMLGSHGSLTGAPEKHHGEAVEQEAHNFVSSFGAIALSSAAGKGHDDVAKDSDDETPDPTNVAMKAVDANKDASTGDAKSDDKAKTPVDEAMWAKMRPVMHVVGDVADVWERFANLLSPTPPFPRTTARLRLAGALAPLFLLSLVLSPYYFTKATSFLAGAGFFGAPLTTRALAWLNQNYPEWPAYVDIRNTLLKGVPTNAQLTLTLLRLAEARRAPLPPPPSSATDATAHAVKPPSADAAENLPPASAAEVADAIHPDPTNPDPTSPTPSSSNTPDKPKKHHPGRKLLSFFKNATGAGVSTSLSTDPLKANLLGSEKAKARLGAVPAADAEPDEAGPTTFPARLHGKRGSVVVRGGVVRWVRGGGKDGETAGEGEGEVVGSVADVVEMRKTGGLGWMSRVMVGWSLQRDVVGGLEVVEVETWRFTAVGMRDEMFNRLVAMGGQKWESW
ncbi:hypothetical protein EDC01DRAFT_719812 [Geopyxis carbonaria]|nr:hypothetical protein EDC01DRAFT_719812 [Geopyxis carbonaria]